MQLSPNKMADSLYMTFWDAIFQEIVPDRINTSLNLFSKVLLTIHLHWFR